MKLWYLLVAALSLTLIFAPSYSTSLEAPYVSIHCEMNISYLDLRLSLPENFSLKIIFRGDDEQYVIYRNYKPTLAIIPNKEIKIIDLNVLYLNSTLYYHYNITSSTAKLLMKLCKQNISSILEYIQKTNFTYYYCNFYYEKPKSKENYFQKVDDWYLVCTSPKIPDTTPPLADDFLIYFISFFLPVLVYLLLFVIFLKTNYLLGILFIMGIFLIFVHFIKIKQHRCYLFPILFGIFGSIGYYLIKDKKIKVLIVGLIISSILFILLNNELGRLFVEVGIFFILSIF